MALRDDIPALVQHYKDQKSHLDHNRILFNIFEGDLLTYVLLDLQQQLSQRSYDQIKHRVPPINILKRLIDKLSKIYAKAPTRTLGNDTIQNDQDLLDFYEKAMDVNTVMGAANEFFNLFKTSYVEPYLYRGKPQLRVVPSDRCLPYSNDPVNPQHMTHFIKVMGVIMKNTFGPKGEPVATEERTILYLYTDEEFLVVDDHGEIIAEIMARPEIAALGGMNPFGKIPFIYLNRSRFSLIPTQDTDTLAMTKLIPVLLADANFAAMFQAFSIIYGIDLDEEGLTMAPNAFWRFKSDPTKTSKPEVGVIKPELDTDKMLHLIKSELSLWLQSRNIKPGAMGELTVDNLASGIAKAIDEMDTSEDRQKQIPFFMQGEAELWDFIVNHAHPVWIRDPDFANKTAFSPGAEVTTQFAEQKPLINYSQIIDDVIKKRNERLLDLKRALVEIYPDESDEQIMSRIADIKADNTFITQTVSVAPIPDSANNPGNDPAAAGVFN